MSKDEREIRREMTVLHNTCDKLSGLSTELNTLLKPISSQESTKLEECNETRQDTKTEFGKEIRDLSDYVNNICRELEQSKLSLEL